MAEELSDLELRLDVPLSGGGAGKLRGLLPVLRDAPGFDVRDGEGELRARVTLRCGGVQFVQRPIFDGTTQQLGPAEIGCQPSKQTLCPLAAARAIWGF